ncbi:MAG: hypothetical protein ABIE22_02085 [archaeon]
MTKFNCKGCNYRFELNKEESPERCPYCDMKGSVMKEQTADEILDEIDNIK